MNSLPELLVVMPVFNEQESIERVLMEWMSALEAANTGFLLLVINDGSTDGTADVLAKLGIHFGDKLEVRSRGNLGHGQTCLEGYRIALERNIPFILQIDSDGQSSAVHFHEFWSLRNSYDVIYGKRQRSDGMRRVFASALLRLLLRLRAGVDCVDANVPYRLMNARACGFAIRKIPPSIDLANIAMAICLKRNPAIRHGAVRIAFPPRIGGEPSVPFSKFAIKALELGQQIKQLN